jgi:hypothetical protein
VVGRQHHMAQKVRRRVDGLRRHQGDERCRGQHPSGAGHRQQQTKAYQAPVTAAHGVTRVLPAGPVTDDQVQVHDVAAFKGAADGVEAGGQQPEMLARQQQQTAKGGQHRTMRQAEPAIGWVSQMVRITGRVIGPGTGEGGDEGMLVCGTMGMRIPAAPALALDKG